MIRAGMDCKWLFGPYFFAEVFIQHTHPDMLQNWFESQLENLGIKSDA
jgi:hypothetical protein